MKYPLIILSVFLFSLSLPAQEPVPNETSGKGITSLSSPTGGGREGVTYAVVVGISDYQDEGIPDLRFADKDAVAFKSYLQSPGGGVIPEENIQTLINEKATTGHMVAAMGWLVEVCEPGDKAIIYFSGHGDVERISKFQRGYLLTYNSPPNNYMAGAFPVFGLQDIISTLSDKDVQVVMVSDACRAGKLAGSNINGTQATSSVLAQQFANETKILSCQPDEYSLEGEQWGGGRGCFSYHLLDGLYGLADKNSDDIINLLEIERYLEDKVMTETAPHSQIPMTVGNKGTVLATVDKQYMEKILTDKEKQQPMLAAIESKGMEDLILENADSTIQELYQDFLAAIENGNLMEPEGQSADDYYKILSREESIEKLHGFMRRNFAAALQDESQAALQDYFYSTEKYYAEYFHTEKKSVKNFAKYLERATELLGDSHYMYNSLKARQLYFTCHNLWENNQNIDQEELYEMIIDTCHEALKYDDEAAYIYLGLANTYLFADTTEAIQNFELALKYAPEWAVLHTDYAIFNRDLLKLDKAIEHCKKAIEIDSNMMHAYQWLSYIYTVSGDYENRNNVLNQTAKRLEFIISTTKEEDVFPYYFYQLGETYWMLNVKAERSEEVLKKAKKYVGEKMPRIHTLLGAIYKNNNRYEEAETELRLAIENTRTGGEEPMAYLAELYHFKLGKHKEAAELVLEAIKTINPSERGRLRYYYELLGSIYIDQYSNLNRMSDAEWLYLKAIEMNPNSVKTMVQLAKVYEKKMEYKKAINWREKALSIFPDNPGVLYEIGKNLYLSKQPEKAEEYFQKILVKRYKRFYNSIGWFYKNHGEFKFAEPYLLKSSEAKISYHADANLAIIYAQQGDYKKAVDWLEKSKINFPDDPMLDHMRLVYSFYMYPKEQVGDLFNEQEVNYPGITKLYDYLCFIENEDYEKAINIWDKGNLNNFSRFFYTHLQLGAWAQKGKMEEAIKLMNSSGISSLNYHILSTYPPISPLRKEEAYKKYVRKHFPEKFDDLDQYEFELPEPVYHPTNCVLLGQFYEEHEEWLRAEFLYHKAMELRPEYDSAYVALKKLYDEHPEVAFEKTERALKKSIAEKTDDPDTYLALATLSAYEGKKEQAIQHYNKAISLSEDPKNPLKLLGNYYLKNDRYIEAKSVFDQIAAFEITRPEEVYELAAAYLKMEDEISWKGVVEKGIGNFRRISDIYKMSIGFVNNNNEAALDFTIQKGIEEKYPEGNALYYNNACLYSLANKKEKAIQQLESAIQKGYKDYAHMQKDTDLDNIRNTDRFKELMRLHFPEKTTH